MTDFSNFPYEIVETTGESALATWKTLRAAGRGAPVVLGDDFENLLFPFNPDPKIRERWTPVEKILAMADAIVFPDDLCRPRHDVAAMVCSNTIAPATDGTAPEDKTPLGEWPDTITYRPNLSVAYDVLTDRPRATVYIALIPTDDPTAIPAYMQWGNFNQCPSAAQHVAALRSWRDRYGAELVGLDADRINLRVARKPSTRDEALELAREHYLYCNDIIDQGVQTYRALAAGLMVSDWWYFWWD